MNKVQNLYGEKIKLSVTLYNLSADGSVCIEEQKSLELWYELTLQSWIMAFYVIEREVQEDRKHSEASNFCFIEIRGGNILQINACRCQSYFPDLHQSQSKKRWKKAQGNQYQFCTTGKWWPPSASLPEDMTKGNLSPAAINDDYKS